MDMHIRAIRDPIEHLHTQLGWTARDPIEHIYTKLWWTARDPMEHMHTQQVWAIRDPIEQYTQLGWAQSYSWSKVLLPGAGAADAVSSLPRSWTLYSFATIFYS